MTAYQRKVLGYLALPDAYLSEGRTGVYMLRGSGVRVCGVALDPIIYERTVRALLRDGLIVHAKRDCNSRLHIGYFLSEKAERLKREAAGPEVASC